MALPRGFSFCSVLILSGLVTASLAFGQTLPVLGDSSSTVSATGDIRPLEQGNPIERQLAGGETHSYQVTVRSGQYLHVTIEQIGIAVKMTLFAPDGKPLARSYSPNGKQGSEPISLIASASGKYRLDVLPAQSEAPRGRYSVRVDTRIHVCWSKESKLLVADLLDIAGQYLTMAQDPRPTAELHDTIDLVGWIVAIMYQAYRTKLDLNNNQRTLMAQHAGFARWVYNWARRLWQEAYKAGLKPNAAALRKLFTNHVKPLFPWMSELSSKVYQYAFRALSDAFDRFFKGLAKYPKFKKKYHNDSFTLDNGGGKDKPIRIGGVRHKLPFIGWVNTFEALPTCTVKKITISRQAGDWYLSFSIEIPEPSPTPKTVDVVGVDLGVHALATLSTGESIPNPKPLRKALKKLARLQRNQSRKVYGSHNYKKDSLKVARLHRRIANIRKDYLHKLTTLLAKNHGQIAIEDLNVSGMLKNHKLARAIADCGFYEFRRQLEYKCQRYGSEVVIVDRFHPSSQLCSNCGHQQKMPLQEQVYNCASCGISLDRDLNAAINLSRTVG